MMNMMNSTGMMTNYLLLWGLHVLSVIVFAVGVLLLIGWAVKTWQPAQVKTWGVGFLIAGTILCLISIAGRGGPWIGGGFGYKSGMMMQNGMMENMMDEMMEHDEREGSEDHDDMMGMMRMMMGRGSMDGDHDAMRMSMDDMSAMLEGKTGDAFDQAFIEGMIPHHQGAIDMAREALKSAKHEEIKAMARAIISAQQQEINQMEQWLEAWGYTE